MKLASLKQPCFKKIGENVNCVNEMNESQREVNLRAGPLLGSRGRAAPKRVCSRASEVQASENTSNSDDSGTS